MNPSRVVITGTIASGKSSLSEIFRNKGFVVIDADKVNRKLLEKGNINYKAIKDLKIFEDAFCNDNLDKKKLANIIFNDDEKREILNEICHKNIIAYINKIIDNSDEDIIFVEIPLYFQMKVKFDCDFVILVKASKNIQIERLIKRDEIDKSYAIKKIKSQNVSYMEDKSDFIIDNSKDLKYLENQADDFLKKWRKYESDK